MQNLGFQVDPEQELRDIIKVENAIKTNPRYIANHAYLIVKLSNSSEHTLHQDLYSLLQLLLPVQITHELSSTCEEPEMGLLRIF